MIKIDEGIRWPKFDAKFFAGNDLTGILDKYEQDLIGLIL
jgi:hypothetical protein